MDLQYLPEDKKREDDPDIRKMLLETLLLVQKRLCLQDKKNTFRIKHLVFCLFVCFYSAQLTATKSGRKTCRDKNVYVIVRELHKWEEELHVATACEKLVQVRGQTNVSGMMLSVLVLHNRAPLCVFSRSNHKNMPSLMVVLLGADRR